MPDSTHVLALDGGGTKTAAALYGRAGGELATVTVGACNLHQDAAAGIAEIERAWRELGVALGLVGVGRAAPEYPTPSRSPP
jgi:N-acetylglucosamine kinase-like BadF-type ATPase